MKATYLFVPPGGGETDYSLTFEIPSIPQPGDYISITRPDQQGSEDFVVRRTWWGLEFPTSNLSPVKQDPEIIGSLKSVYVECEFAKGPYSSESHKQACQQYDAGEFDNTAY